MLYIFNGDAKRKSKYNYHFIEDFFLWHISICMERVDNCDKLTPLSDNLRIDDYVNSVMKLYTCFKILIISNGHLAILNIVRNRSKTWIIRQLYTFKAIICISIWHWLQSETADKLSSVTFRLTAHNALFSYSITYSYLHLSKEMKKVLGDNIKRNLKVIKKEKRQNAFKSTFKMLNVIIVAGHVDNSGHTEILNQKCFIFCQMFCCYHCKHG